MSGDFGDNHDIIEILNNNQNENDQDDIQLINRDSFENLPDGTGLTPIMSPSDFISDNQLIHRYNNNFSDASSNLPPLAPLSESALPNSLHINLPLALPNDFDKKSKKEPPVPKTRPAFVMKIWSMVNDPANAQYIQWNDDGKSFQVFHREDFMKNILPKYFKHKNFASFVRQLNMYGWHKVQDITSGTLKDDKNSDESWKFENPYFLRDREDLLDNIVRNRAMNQEENKDGKLNLQAMLAELEALKMNQLAITEDLRRIRKDNQTIWQENYLTRERHQKQTQTLDKILKFLATIYGNNTTGKILEVDDYNLDLTQLTTYDKNNDPLNHINNYNPPNPSQEVFSGDMSPQPKPRLMLMNQAYQSTPSDKSTNSPANGSTRNGSVDEIGNDANQRLYQQLMNDSVPSPRHIFPDIDLQPHVKPETDVISGLEQNIYKQGQSIQQVQDWIQKLANQQQIQQQQIKLQAEKDKGEFDMSEFLDPSTPQPIVTTPGSDKDKRTIEQIDENPSKRVKK